MENGIYAHFNTSKGKIIVQLTFEKTPGTVGNFIGLAEGKIENTAKDLGAPYYNDLQFHRVIENFMVQGGDPRGNGTGGPGYQFDDEIHPDLNTTELEFCLWQTQALEPTGVSFLLLMVLRVG